MFLIRVGAKLCRTVALQDRSFPASHHDKNLRLYQIQYINVFQMFFHFHLMISWNFFDRFVIFNCSLNIVLCGSQPRSCRPPNTACFPCHLNQTHLIQIINRDSNAWIGGVRQRWDEKRAVLGASRNVVGNHCLMICEWRIFSVILYHCCAT